MPTTLRAKCIGSLALKALSTGNPDVAGQVVNTFSSSLYLRTGSGELVFVTNRPARSPITINLDTTGNLERVAETTEPVRIHGKEIHVGADTIIDLHEASIYQNQPSPPNELKSEFAGIEKPMRTISSILRIVDVNQSVLDPHYFAHAGMLDFLSDGIIPLRHSGTEERFRNAALKIVGLGSGFTPSGDDALGGFLFAYNAFAQAIGRTPILLERRLLEERTSWISARLLDYMQNLVADEQLHHIIDSAISGDEDAIVVALETLLPRGHTSGIDIAVGAVLALSLVRDIAFGRKETQIIAHTLGLGRGASP